MMLRYGDTAISVKTMYKDTLSETYTPYEKGFDVTFYFDDDNGGNLLEQ